MPDLVNKVGDVLRVSTEYLAARNVYQPRQACELLLSRLLNCKRLEILVRFETRLSGKQLDAMRRGVKRLAAGEPVQYIAGEVEFMGHVFKVDRRALIPRPETELLVEAVLECPGIWQEADPLVADVGTGCGCIAVSIALARPAARCIAFDVAVEALELAAENAHALGALDRIRFARGELSDTADPDSLDAVVANLPYIPSPVLDKLPVHIRNFEPRTALDGGPDGLSVISGAVPDAWFALKPGGLLCLEIGDDQGGRVGTLLGDGEFEEVRVHKDLAGKDRIVTGIKKRS